MQHELLIAFSVWMFLFGIVMAGTFLKDTEFDVKGKEFRFSWMCFTWPVSVPVAIFISWLRSR